MKNFEKWEGGEGCDTPNEVCELVRDCSACTQLKEEGWRAALKWVLTHRADIINTKFIEEELKS